jgi:hypothetical protein
MVKKGNGGVTNGERVGLKGGRGRFGLKVRKG